MKLRIFHMAASLIGAVLLLGLGLQAHASNYYISNSGCNDNNAGTSSGAPWCNVTKINGRTFSAGDTINLAAGSSWTITSTITPAGNGSSGSPITLTSYGSGAMPVINGNNNSSLTLLALTNPSYWVIENIEFENAGLAFGGTYTSGTFGSQSVTIQNNYVQNMVQGGMGFGTVSGATLPNSSQWVLNGLYFIGNLITSEGSVSGTASCALGAGAGTIDDTSIYAFQNVVIRDNYLWSLGDTGVACLFGASNVLIMDNWEYSLGNDSSSNGTTANFITGTNNVTFVNNYMDDMANTGSYDETGLDLECQNNNTNLWTNYFGNTYGPGVELLQLGGRLGDYSTNTSFLGNTFDSDGTQSNNETQPGSSVVSESDSGDTITGTLNNNISYQSSNNFLATRGNNSFSQSNNLSASSSGNIYYYAKNWNTGYKGTQGANGWGYQTYNGSGFSNMSYNSTSGEWTGANGGYVGLMNMQAPSSTSDANAMTWTAPSTGTMSLRGRVLMETTGGSGVHAYWAYSHNGTWTNEWNQNISGSNQTGYDLTMDNIPVTAGDTFFFYIFPNANNDSNAVVSWQPMLAYITSGGTNLLGNASWGMGNLTDWSVWVASGSPNASFVNAGTTAPTSYNGDAYDLVMWNTSGYTNAIYQNVTGQPSGHSFTATVWARTNFPSGNGSLYVMDGVGGSTVLCQTNIPASTTSWTQFSCSGTVPSDGQLNFNVAGSTTAGSVWIQFDNASLTVN